MCPNLNEKTPPTKQKKQTKNNNWNCFLLHHLLCKSIIASCSQESRIFFPLGRAWFPQDQAVLWGPKGERLWAQQSSEIEVHGVFLGVPGYQTHTSEDGWFEGPHGDPGSGLRTPMQLWLQHFYCSHLKYWGSWSKVVRKFCFASFNRLFLWKQSYGR